MNRSKLTILAKLGVALSAIPIAIIASSSGAPTGVTGAPGEQTCGQAGCHVGTPVNGGGGRVEISFSGGTSYTPGERGTVTVTITDANAKRYGFSGSARLSANNGQAGALQAGTNLQVETPVGIQYITHRTSNLANTFQFEWTPPATGAGEVKFYVAANAANGNDTASGDQIYTGSLTLAEGGTTGGGRPVISQGGISDSFTGTAGLASSSWISIYGQNLARGTKTWDDAEFRSTFEAGRLPQSIDGVSVSVNGLPASIYFVSPGQINVLAPLDESVGEVAVVVKTAAGESTPVTVRKTAVLPAPYAPFGEGTRRYITGVSTTLRADGGPVYVGKTGIDPRVTRGARPGETVQIFASGLGATQPAILTDRVVTAPATLANAPSIRIRDTPVSVVGSALVAPGLYQINALIPLLPPGDHPLVVEVGGSRSSPNVFITIQQ